MNKLRNNGIYSQDEYVGKSLEDATKYAEEGGFVTRVTEKDGTAYMFTMEYRGDRLNFRIFNEKVIDVYGG